MKIKRFRGRRRPFRRIFWALLAVVLAAYLYLGNELVVTTAYAIASPAIPAGFDGYRIAQVSDLHNDSFGRDNGRLVKALEKAQADSIVITGDLVDSRRTDVDVAVSLAAQCVRIAPTYYVTGNHEENIADFSGLVERLQAAGVTVLRTEVAELERGGDTIHLVGADDPFMLPKHIGYGANAERMAQALQEVMPAEGYTVLLAHRPELFDTYIAVGADLILSGHLHGGQIRIPFLGGLFMPSQGFFPAYDGGAYTQGDAQMIVSRGLGNSRFPLRVNNFPELVVVTLETA